MGAMIAAYLIAWLVVSAYGGWLSLQNRRLAQRLDELEARPDLANRRAA